MKHDSIVIDHNQTSINGMKASGLCFKINNVDIWPKNSVKYLEIFFGTGNSFREHLKKVNEKAEDKVARIIKWMTNIGEPINCKRALLATVAHSILLYRVPVRKQALSIRRNCMLLQKVQRKNPNQSCGSL